MRKGVATLPLDRGKCPRWLFEKMKKLTRAIAIAIVEEFGREEFLKRISDPIWFQSFSAVIGMDWNSSGTTTITLGALKASLFDISDNLGIYICGGKKTSRKTPEEIEFLSFKKGFKFGKKLIYLSKLVAKVDNSLLQDGFSLYHHNFIFSKDGKWTVVQQGMNSVLKRARRYHWFSDRIKDFTEEPAQEIITDFKTKPLNLVSKKSRENKIFSLRLIKESPKRFLKDIALISQKADRLMIQKRFSHFTILNLKDVEFYNHPVVKEKFDLKRLKKIIYKISFFSPNHFEDLLMIEGVGPKTIRALSLVAEIIYGAKPSFEDPARYSFAHGGKDGTPFPIERERYTQILSLLEKVIKKAKLPFLEKEKSLKRLYEQRIS